MTHSAVSRAPFMGRGAGGYVISLSLTAIAVVATIPLERTVARFPYLPLLVAAVITSAWIGGLGPGLLAAGVGAVAAEYLFFGGLSALGSDPGLFAQLGIFVVVAAIGTSLRVRRVRAASARRNRLLWELEERVKELTLLHRATSLLQEEKDLETLLRELVGLIPSAWQFPEILEARITVGDLAVTTPRFRVTPWIQRVEFSIPSGPPGLLEVVYLEAPPGTADEPFFPEERSLIDSLGRLLTSYFERIERQKERLELTRAQASRTEAEAANRMKDAFLATVSHELRRPLTAVLGWTHMLRKGDRVDVARGLEVIDRNANIQLRLIEELLDLARTTSGQLGVTFSLTNLNEIVQNGADAARPAASKQGVEIALDVDGGYTPVLGDGMRLQQIIGNLIGNALKFTPAGGRVTIALSSTAEAAEIQVIDTGIGIEPVKLAQMFEPFWQADPSTGPSREGLGLGLALVRRLVDLHGGTIEAHSEGLNRGTRMTVRLPLANEQLIPNAVAEASRPLQ